MLHTLIRVTVNTVVGDHQKLEFYKQVRIIPFTFEKRICYDFIIDNTWKICFNFLGLSATIRSDESEYKGVVGNRLRFYFKLFGYPKYDPDKDDIPF